MTGGYQPTGPAEPGPPPRSATAVVIAREYPAPSAFVADLLEVFADDEAKVRAWLDAFCPLGFVPGAEMVRDLEAALERLEAAGRETADDELERERLRELVARARRRERFLRRYRNRGRR